MELTDLPYELNIHFAMDVLENILKKHDLLLLIQHISVIGIVRFPFYVMEALDYYYGENSKQYQYYSKVLFSKFFKEVSDILRDIYNNYDNVIEIEKAVKIEFFKKNHKDNIKEYMFYKG